ncbi:hypothetical protein GIV63_23415, partial [Pseudomonas sp. PA-3-10C]|nr:hypothetical protein [Pseudomonas sp. PA-3-10C]
MNKSQLAVLLPLLGSMSAPAWAGQTEQTQAAPTSLQLQATVVSATRSETSIAQIPVAVPAINEAPIRQQHGSVRRV